MQRRQFLAFVGVTLAGSAGLSAPADADSQITVQAADETIGLMVLHRSDSLGVIELGPAVRRAIRLGWFAEPDPRSDYGLKIREDGKPYYKTLSLRLTPSGRAYGEKVLQRWRTEGHTIALSGLTAKQRSIWLAELQTPGVWAPQAPVRS